MEHTNKQATATTQTDKEKQVSEQKKNTYSKPKLTSLGTTNDIRGSFLNVGADGFYS